MVGVVHLPADLWTLRTSAPKLDTTVCQLINRLGIQRRPTKRGCRAGWLVRQSYRPDDNINTTKTETETDLPFTTTPIPVIYTSRRRTFRSAARHLHPSTLLRFLGLHYHSVLTMWVTMIPSHRHLAQAFSTRPLRRHGIKSSSIVTMTRLYCDAISSMSRSVLVVSSRLTSSFSCQLISIISGLVGR